MFKPEKVILRGHWQASSRLSADEGLLSSNVVKHAFFAKCLRIASRKPGHIPSSLALDAYTIHTAKSPVTAQLDFDAGRELQRCRKVFFILFNVFVEFEERYTESLYLCHNALHEFYERRFDAAVVADGASHQHVYGKGFV